MGMDKSSGWSRRCGCGSGTGKGWALAVLLVLLLAQGNVCYHHAHYSSPDDGYFEDDLYGDDPYYADDPYNQPLPATATHPPEKVLFLDHMELSQHSIELQRDAPNKLALTLKVRSEFGLVDVTYDPMIVPSQAMFASANGNYIVFYFYPFEHLVQGDSKHGTYRTETEISYWNTENGPYDLVSVYLIDELGHQRPYQQHDIPHLPMRFTVSGAMKDITPPLLLNVHLPTMRFPSEAASGFPGPFVLYLDVEDTESGLSEVSNGYISHSFVILKSVDAPATQLVQVAFSFENSTDQLPASYQPTHASSGMVHLLLNTTMPTHAWPGMWEISSIELTDGAGNTATWAKRDLQEQGWQTYAYVENKNLTYAGDDLFHYVERKYKDIDDYYGDGYYD